MSLLALRVGMELGCGNLEFVDDLVNAAARGRGALQLVSALLEVPDHKAAVALKGVRGKLQCLLHGLENDVAVARGRPRHRSPGHEAGIGVCLARP